ncbi:MAG: relaxase/mobilization nuclease domain-containing protein [Thermoanaerobaculia bacterium]|nr:relaxase/mobilization nuclease domain-containing protein [Thermoanaerobaculia bacterium]
MIGKAGSGKGFRGLQDYLLENDRAAWVSTRNLFVPDLEYVPAMMRETAKLSDRVEKPVYHLSIALAPGESLTPEQWEAVAERVLGKLGLGEHQALLALHQDKEHEHLHVMVNRVHPDTGRAWSAWQDWVIRERELRVIEKDLGLTQVHGPGFLLEKGQKLDRTNAVTTGERQERERTGEAAFIEKIRRETGHHFRDAESWADLSARLHGYGLQLESRGRGLVVTDGERMVKASRIARATSRGALEKRLGPFADWARDVAQLREHIDREATRQRAGDDWQRVVKIASDAEGLAERFRDTVKRFEQSGERLKAQLAQVYHPADLPAALARLKNEAKKDPEAAAQKLRERPQEFGRLRGQEWGPIATPDRHRAHQALPRAAEELRRFEQLRQEVHHLQPAARAAERRQPQLRQHARNLAETKFRLRPEDHQLTHLGRLVVHHGERNILAMLGPAATTLRLARAAFQGTLGRTVVSMAVDRLLGPAAGPVFLIGRAIEMVRGEEREGGRER